jgi:hypothetical protein
VGHISDEISDLTDAASDVPGSRYKVILACEEPTWEKSLAPDWFIIRSGVRVPRKLRELRADLRAAGFAIDHQTGSHQVWKHPLIPGISANLAGKTYGEMSRASMWGREWDETGVLDSSASPTSTG